LLNGNSQRACNNWVYALKKALKFAFICWPFFILQCCQLFTILFCSALVSSFIIPMVEFCLKETSLSFFLSFHFSFLYSLFFACKYIYVWTFFQNKICEIKYDCCCYWFWCCYCCCCCCLRYENLFLLNLRDSMRVYQVKLLNLNYFHFHRDCVPLTQLAINMQLQSG
jgi:hypothetical protein